MSGGHHILLIVSMYHLYIKAWWWQRHVMGGFSAARTGTVGRVQGRKNSVKYRDITEKTQQ